jgi:hypothetical protein
LIVKAGLRSPGTGEYASVKERAARRASDIGPTIKVLQENGATSLRAIAAGLNEQGIPTARGQGKWSAVRAFLSGFNAS